MVSIPVQRETAVRSARPPGPPPVAAPSVVVRTSLPGNQLAASAARRFVRAALADWTALGLPTATGFTDQLADDAVLIVSELVTNAVVHAGTTVDLLVRLEEALADEPPALVVEISDHHPARAVRNEPEAQQDPGIPEYGRGLRLVSALAESWGITYHTGRKTVWTRLPVGDGDPHPAPGSDQRLQWGLRAAEILAPAPRRAPGDDREWSSGGALSFLAEASELLAGQFDEDMIAALAGQLLVPRLGDWCAVWLDPEAGGPGRRPRLSRVWHTKENRIDELRAALEREPPKLPESARGAGVPVPWPGLNEPPGATGGAGAAGTDGVALGYRLLAAGRPLGTLLLGRTGLQRASEEVSGLVEDFARRVALAIAAARQYTRQATISRVLQRGLLPSSVAEIPGVDSALVYEPRGEGVVGGDFYDVFPGDAAGGRWCFALGDVQGSGPEAAVVTGLARPWLRLLAREGYQVSGVLDRLNKLLLDDAMETAEAAARMVAVAGGQDMPEDPQSRFLSLLYGELVPLAGGGVRCTLSSAGHPLPLLLRPDGTVRPAAAPQMLLGVIEGVAYESETFDLLPGDTLLCVTDGVTERRAGPRMFDDGDGLATELADCTGLTAQGVAERIKHAVYAFGIEPLDDDLALLVLRAE
ncbi:MULTISPECIES: SpoIIE family protein phosphatase [unclassified Streptomyces]|uniref:SpoIIE family protein phosphatase n=1 Tax=unclassified Streptomyces TaxID=2593676 RepID=UPI0035AB8027